MPESDLVKIFGPPKKTSIDDGVLWWDFEQAGNRADLRYRKTYWYNIESTPFGIDFAFDVDDQGRVVGRHSYD